MYNHGFAQAGTLLGNMSQLIVVGLLISLNQYYGIIDQYHGIIIDLHKCITLIGTVSQGSDVGCGPLVSLFLCPRYGRLGGMLFLSCLSFCHSIIL